MVQVLSGIGLELLGFTLWFIGLRKPELDEALEEWVDSGEDFAESLGGRMRKSILFQLIFSASIILNAVMGVSWLLNTLTFPVYLWVFFWLINLSVTVVIILHLLVDFVRFLNWLGKGNAVQALGGVIGFISLFIEGYGLYQVFIS